MIGQKKAVMGRPRVGQAISLTLEPEQLAWIDATRGKDFSRAAFVRKVLREAMGAEMKTKTTDLKKIKSLEELLDAILASKIPEQKMSHLPVFGGPMPEDTSGIFSWDKYRLLIANYDSEGRKYGGWLIINRPEYQEDQN